MMSSASSLNAAYGWLMLLGIAASLFAWSRLAKHDPRLILIYLCGLAGAFFGAKVVYFLAEGFLHLHAPDRWAALATGKSILGALPGGYAGVELAKRLVQYPNATGDLFAVVVPIGMIFGRIGCVLHGCCPGQICAPAWFTVRDGDGLPRWPAAEVELLFNIVALIAAVGLRARQRFKGQLFHIYLMAYGVFRFTHEFYRATPHLVGSLTGYQIAAALVALLGAIGFVARDRSIRKTHGLKLMEAGLRSQSANSACRR